MSGWNSRTLYEHFTQRFADQAEAAEQRFQAQESSVARLKEDYDHRFEGVNEFRGQLTDQAREFLPRVEFDAQHQALIDRIDRAKNQTVAIYLSLGSILVSLGAVLAFLLKK